MEDPGWAQIKDVYFSRGRRAQTRWHSQPGNLGGTRGLWRSGHWQRETETETGAWQAVHGLQRPRVPAERRQPPQPQPVCRHRPPGLVP